MPKFDFFLSLKMMMNLEKMIQLPGFQFFLCINNMDDDDNDGNFLV